jgi:acyl-CoA thioesterase-1
MRLLPPARLAALAALLFTAVPPAAQASPVTVVAVGASNTSGWGVGGAAAYPQKLEDMLKARGIDAKVVNAGVVLDTTAGMLNRLDAAVPDGTRIVILQPGGNDARFLRNKEQRAANIQAMVKKLSARGIAAIVYDPTFPPEAYQWDRIHLTAATHAKIATELLPKVTALLGRSKPKQQPAKPGAR